MTAVWVKHPRAADGSATEYIRASAVQAMIDAAVAKERELVESAASIFANCEVLSGCCCCGDDMKTHSDPMACGHSPVDMGEHAVNNWIKEHAAIRGTAP
jgi:hypothetical protein